MHMYIYTFIYIQYMHKKKVCIYTYINIHVNKTCIYMYANAKIDIYNYMQIRLKVFFFHDFPPCDFNQRPPQVPSFARPSVHGQGDAWRGRQSPEGCWRNVRPALCPTCWW